jgi:hypothetical protein
MKKPTQDASRKKSKDTPVKPPHKKRTDPDKSARRKRPAAKSIADATGTLSEGKTGKLSGAAYRKLRKTRLAQAKESVSTTALSKTLLRKLGRPPKDPTQVLPWCNTVLSELTYELLVSKGIQLAERVRQVRETVKAIGMVYPRSELEELLKRLLETLGARKEKASSTERLAKGAWKTQVASVTSEPAPPPADSGS